MKDKEIRRILITALKARNTESRIYQEKSIGGSICDVMVVTNQLIGYEIKSDQDNYARIESQVKQYDQFFDQNYIVIGHSHAKSAEDKVPDYWGIMVITDDSITISRSPKQNPSVNRKRQLSMLWKLELKNLLIYFRQPMFALKSKDFIIKKLLENIPSKQLGKQIAYELLHRDYSIYDAEDYTEYSKNESMDLPDISDIHTRELVDNVSEMDVEKFSLDQWIDIYRRAKKVNETKEQLQNEWRIKRDRKEHKITYKEIDVYPGVPWISAEIIGEFAGYLVDEEKDVRYCPKVYYEPITGNWHIERKKEGEFHSARCCMKYGLEQYNALFILEATLNLRDIKLYTNERKYDEESTLAALEKQKMIIEAFKEWVWQDEDRRWEIEEAYNQMFGNYKKEHFDGSKLKFPEMAPEHKLYAYQKDAVQKIISTDNTLLAFDVGAGKTFIMISAAMLMRQQGISRKNMFVVPNNIVGQWEKIFTELYPKAKVLVVEPKNFKRPVREKMMNQMKYGDYDGIIIAYSCFEMIPVSSEYITKQMESKVTEINKEIKKIGYEPGSRCALERLKENVIKLSQELIKSIDYSAPMVTFDELEINTLFLDEAHNYKNLPIKTKMKNIRGINVRGSSKCNDMLQKVRYVQNTNNGRGVVFATGTPLSNSLADAYTMQIYLQYDEMKKNNLDKFDNWIKTYARPEKNAEIDVDTQHYRFVTRFAKFYNLPELSAMFSQIAIFHAMKKEDGIPELTNGYTDCIIKKNRELRNYMVSLAERTEKIRTGKVERFKDNMLKVSTDGRKAALDLRLVEKKQPEKSSKIQECVCNVKKIYDDNAECAQLIFCDYSTPKKGRFNVYSSIKNTLVNLGIPEKEIAFIHSYHTEERKLALYSKVNLGEIRILIGSTFKLGIGANVQTKLKAIHHLDVPWRPADMVQREGRILRKGNLYKKVKIFRYICEGSFDAYAWQILETKQSSN